MDINIYIQIYRKKYINACRKMCENITVEVKLSVNY